MLKYKTQMEVIKMNMKQKLIELKNKILFSNKNFDKTENKSNNSTTHLGCMSYEYLKYIKEVQIRNGGLNDYKYLYLLLYFVCRIKMIFSGEQLSFFDDTIKNVFLPIPINCQKYVYRDKLDLVDNLNNLNIFICISSEDEKIIKYVCDEYGNLSFNSLLQKYNEDRLHRACQYMEELPIDNPLSVIEEEKNNIKKLIKIEE